MRDRWHVLMGEVWGWVSGFALVRIAKHADAANDIVTVHRVRAVLRCGIEAGWSDTDPDGGKIVPGRTAVIAKCVREQLGW